MLKRDKVTTEDLEIAVERNEGDILLRLHGRFNIDSSPYLRDRLLAILHEVSRDAVTVDLTEVSYMDASGIATLVEALKIAHNRQRQLSLKGLQGRLLHLLEVTGVLALFEKNHGISVREVN